MQTKSLEVLIRQQMANLNSDYTKLNIIILMNLKRLYYIYYILLWSLICRALKIKWFMYRPFFVLFY